MAIIAGVDYGPRVVEFPWDKKWALMCIEVASREGHERAEELCKVLTVDENNRVARYIKNHRDQLRVMR